jgi:Family of unknown function (DUF5329)
MSRRVATRSLLGLGLPLGWSSLLGLALTTRADAQPTTTMQSEVEHLLGSIQRSGCTFYRNGSWHDAKAAQAHLRGKYERLVTYGQLASAEQFIDKAATQSSFSGQAYRVRCSDGKEVPSRDWMREQLRQFRAAQ